MQNRILVSLLLILSVLAVFWPAHNYDFLSWDDNMNVYANVYLNPPSLENSLHFWTESYAAMYIPFTYTAWSMLAWISQYYPAEPYGMNPHVFHTANIFLHILNTLIVFGILNLLLTHGFGETGKRKEPKLPVEIAAGVGALIFALHPIHVEPVLWVTGMKDLLSGLFSLVALRWYLAYAIASKNGGTGGRVKLLYLIAFAAFLLALLSKPAAVIVPLVLLILDRWAVKRSLKESAQALIGWFIAAGLFAIIAKTVQQSGIEVVTVPLWARPFIAGDTLAFYLYKLVFPLQLGIYYGRTPDYVMQHWWGYVTWIFPFALVAIFWFLKQRKTLLVSLGIFAASLLPILGLVTFRFQYYSTTTDRYAYLAVLGLSLMVSSVLLNRFSKPVALVCLAAVALFGVRSSLQVPVWKSDFALYTNALKVNPVSFASNNSLGVVLAKQGKLSEALNHYKKALKIKPEYANAHSNMGVELAALGRLDEAIVHLKKALVIQPGFPLAKHNLEIALKRLNKAVTRLPNR